MHAICALAGEELEAKFNIGSGKTQILKYRVDEDPLDITNRFMNTLPGGFVGNNQLQ